jgi:MFS family permease
MPFKDRRKMVAKLKKYSDTTFNSLKLRNYRLYFIGQGISQTGTWMQSIAQTWLVLQLTHSGTLIGLLVAAQFLPVLLLGPLGGVLADRFPKRRILYVTQTNAMVLSLILAVLVQTHVVQVWMVFVLAGLLGLGQVVDNPTRQSFVVEMVGKDNLTNAVSLNSVQLNLSRVIGPSIAGLLIANVGINWCFFLNSASYIAVLICLYLMNAKELSPAKQSKKIQGQLMAGLTYVKNTPILRDTLIMLAFIGTLSYEFQVVLPLFASRTFHGDASTYALLTASMSIGSIAGGLVVANRKRYTMATVSLAAILFGCFMLLTAAAGSVIIAVLTLLGVGFGSIMFTSLANSMLQLNSSSEMRGRVMSLWSVAFLGSTPIGGPVIGWLSDQTNPRIGLAVGGITAIAAALFGLRLFLKVKTSAVLKRQPRSSVNRQMHT